MSIKEEMTAPYAPVDAGAEQSFKNLTNKKLRKIATLKLNISPESR